MKILVSYRMQHDSLILKRADTEIKHVLETLD